ncbi:hypothetical protein TRVL_04135 [Trypanosoma vivax]|nr:hypothetical protein TRVL_04135 [Trypanosoma vivax]
MSTNKENTNPLLKDSARINGQRKEEAGKCLSPRLPCSPSHFPPPRDIHLPQPVAAPNPTSSVLGRGNVGTRAPNTLLLQLLIDKRRLVHQRIRMCAAFLHYIHRRFVIDAIVQIFRRRFSKGTGR